MPLFHILWEKLVAIHQSWIMLLAIVLLNNTSPKILGMGSFNLGDYVNENLAVTMCHKGVKV